VKGDTGASAQSLAVQVTRQAIRQDIKVSVGEGLLADDQGSAGAVAPDRTDKKACRRWACRNRIHPQPKSNSRFR
jgi:hypothetical protein